MRGELPRRAAGVICGMHSRSVLAAVVFSALGSMSTPLPAQAPADDDRKSLVGTWSGGMPGEPKGGIAH